MRRVATTGPSASAATAADPGGTDVAEVDDSSATVEDATIDSDVPEADTDDPGEASGDPGESES